VLKIQFSHFFSNIRVQFFHLKGKWRWWLELVEDGEWIILLLFGGGRINFLLAQSKTAPNAGNWIKGDGRRQKYLPSFFF
jgi:hypothetical protein